MMPPILYDSGPNGLWVFLLCTVVLGGGTAYISGKVIAQTWRPQWQLPVYVLLIALAVRFMHFALFEEVLVSLKNLGVDYAVLMACGLTGYMAMRRAQMSKQYGWVAAADRAAAKHQADAS